MADEGRSLAPPTRKLQLVQIYIGGNYRVGKERAEMEKRADGADASVLFFSCAVLIF